MARLLFDPLTVPVDYVPGEAALASERLDSAWLRERLAHQPPWTVEGDEERHWSQIAQQQPIRAAAVLIAIVLHESGPTLLLTQRNADLTDHPGQISFPGGRVEASDASPVETALRETEEEIGLSRRHVEIIGRLPQYRHRHRLRRHANSGAGDAAVRIATRCARGRRKCSKCRYRF